MKKPAKPTAPAAEKTARMKRAAKNPESPAPDQKRPPPKTGAVKKMPLSEEKVAKKK